MYKDEWTGIEYNSFEEYCNSDDIDPDLIFNYLAQGKRTPKNEEERKWQEEGRLLLEKGGYDISFN